MTCPLCEEDAYVEFSKGIGGLVKKIPFYDATHRLEIEIRPLKVCVNIPVAYCPMCGKRLEDV